MQLVQVRTQRLLHTGNPTEQVVRFEYDALGRRVAKHTDAAVPLLSNAKEGAARPAALPAAILTTRFVWEGNRLQQESTTGGKNSNASSRTYVWEPNSFIPLARIDDSLQKQEQLARSAPALVAQNINIFDEDDSEDSLSNFAALKQRIAAPPSLAQLQALGTKAQALQQALDTGHGHPPAAASTTRILHYHCDHLGTPQELTDEEGKLVWSVNYAAWGKVRLHLISCTMGYAEFLTTIPRIPTDSAPVTHCSGRIMIVYW